MALNQSDQNVLTRHADIVARFKEFLGSTPAEALEEVDMYDFSVGFFIGAGIPCSDLGDPDVESDAWALARICRYEFQYWC